MDEIIISRKLCISQLARRAYYKTIVFARVGAIKNVFKCKYGRRNSGTHRVSGVRGARSKKRIKKKKKLKPNRRKLDVQYTTRIH